MHRAALACAGMLLLGCDHQDAFSPTAERPTSPWQAGPTAQLTLNQRTDLMPSFLPDGSALLYTYDEAGSGTVVDRCLGVIPGTGGSRTAEFCAAGVFGRDSVEAVENASASASGHLLYQLSRSPAGALAPTSSGLMLATLERPEVATLVTTVPYTLPGGRKHDRIGPISWVDDDRAVYVGSGLSYPELVVLRVKDTTEIDGEVVLVDLSGATPQLSIVPGTAGATGVAADPGAGHLWITFRGDSSLYSLPVTGGTPTPRHHFGSQGIPRDPSRAPAGVRLVVGGRLAVIDDPLLGLIQPDSGGFLAHFDNATGTATVQHQGHPRLYRHPVERPGAHGRVVAEGFPLIITQVRDPNTGDIVRLDTTVSRAADLWLLELP